MLVGFVLFEGKSSLKISLDFDGLVGLEKIGQHIPFNYSKIGHSYEAFDLKHWVLSHVQSVEMSGRIEGCNGCAKSQAGKSKPVAQRPNSQ